MELNISYNWTGPQTQQPQIYCQALQKDIPEKKKKKKKGKALSTAAPNKGEIDTSKSDPEADCGASYKKRSTQCAPEAGEECAGRTLGGRREAGFEAAFPGRAGL